MYIFSVQNFSEHGNEKLANIHNSEFLPPHSVMHAFTLIFSNRNALNQDHQKYVNLGCVIFPSPYIIQTGFLFQNSVQCSVKTTYFFLLFSCSFFNVILSLPDVFYTGVERAVSLFEIRGILKSLTHVNKALDIPGERVGWTDRPGFEVPAAWLLVTSSSVSAPYA